MQIHGSDIAMRLKSLIVGLALALAAGPGQAATLFSVDGDRSGTAPIGEGSPDKGVAQSFEVTETLTDVGFSFDLTCNDCAGELWLISGRMSGSVLNSQKVAQVDPWSERVSGKDKHEFRPMASIGFGQAAE